MKKKVLSSNAKQAFLILGFSLLLIILGFACLLLLGLFNSAWSFLAGGLTILIPNVWQVSSMFKEPVASAAKRIVRRFYRTELLKFCFVGIVFVGLAKLTSLNVLSFIVGILFAQLGFWFFGPILMSLKR